MAAGLVQRQARTQAPQYPKRLLRPGPVQDHGTQGADLRIGTEHRSFHTMTLTQLWLRCMETHELTPGEMSQRSGVAVSALHFYEREGLITSRRTSGNQRRYARETLRRVAFIRMSQRLGIPLARIREALAALPADRVPTSKGQLIAA